MSIDVKNDLKIKAASEPSVLKNISHTDIDVSYCGEKCILREIAISEMAIIPLSASNSIKIGLKIDNDLYVSLQEKNWNQDHLYGLEISRSVSQKYEILGLLEQNPHHSLANIKSHCRCTLKMSFVEGKLLDINIWGGLQSNFTQDSKFVIREFALFVSMMSDLIDGMVHLHRIGLAHTDPIPSNVMVAGNGKPYWIDQDDAVMLTPMNLCLDNVVFYHFTWLTLLGQLEYIDNDFVIKADEIYQTATDHEFMPNLKKLIDDYRLSNQLTLNTRKAVPLKLDNDLISEAGKFQERLAVSRIILTRAFAFYKITTTDSLVESKVLSNLLKSEMHRQSIFAREHEKTNLEHKRWIEELEKGKEWLESQWKNWQKEANHLREELDKELVEKKALEQQLNTLQKELTEKKALEQQLNTLQYEASQMQDRINELEENSNILTRSKWLKFGKVFGLFKKY